MPKAKVNGVEVEFEAGMTALQVAEAAGEEIPRFCYHERLSIAGNCRMCLVEVKPGPPKPQASCALPAAEGMEITTNSPMVKKAREGVMEFLLINHPLDCPICDQGGECDLQDQAVGYGRDDSRYLINKRAVEEKNMGPLVKTVMTRCIHCTRCIRFMAEIGGKHELGATGRGEDMEITTYLEENLHSELVGNINDLCPVGALTHRPWSFNYRPWELKKVEGIDVHDALGSNIVFQARGNEVMRALPRIHEGVNEEWLSDKSRYAIDGLLRQRLDRPYIRVGGKLREASWAEAFDAIAARLRGTAPDRVGVIAGDLQDAESMKAALDLFGGAGIPNLDCRQDGAPIGGGARESYLFNTTVLGLEQADAVLLIGSNPRLESPVLNTRIRKAWWLNNARVGVIGQVDDLTYPFERLGEAASAIGAIGGAFAETLRGAQRPAVIIGSGALARPDGAAILRAAAQAAGTFNMVREGWNGFNVLHTAASRVGGLDLGFLPRAGGMGAHQMLGAAGRGALDVLFLMGADEIDTRGLGETFVVYMGTHGDAGASRADVILPSAAYTEKPGIYVNTEGRVQMAERVVFPKGEAREDWAILRALSERLGAKLPYDNITELRARLIADHPTFGQVDYVRTGAALDLSAVGVQGELSDAPLRSAVTDFYLTNPIARASATMAECVAARAPAMPMAAE